MTHYFNNIYVQIIITISFIDVNSHENCVHDLINLVQYLHVLILYDSTLTIRELD